MQPDEALAFGITEELRKEYFRVDTGKVNITRSGKPARWFRLVGVLLGNATEIYPSGDEVQTVEPWNPPDAWADLSIVTINAALTEINAGMPNGQRYSRAASAKDRAAWPVVQRHCPHKTEAQCREIVRVWFRNGVLYDEEYDDPVYRKPRDGLCVNHAKRPGSETVT
jgi:hypothetical protein